VALHASLEINVLTEFQMQLTLEVGSLFTDKLWAKSGARIVDNGRCDRIGNFRIQF
jgi:hypothetical protein